MEFVFHSFGLIELFIGLAASVTSFRMPLPLSFSRHRGWNGSVFDAWACELIHKRLVLDIVSKCCSKKVVCLSKNRKIADRLQTEKCKQWRLNDQQLIKQNHSCRLQPISKKINYWGLTRISNLQFSNLHHRHQYLIQHVQTDWNWDIFEIKKNSIRKWYNQLSHTSVK